MESPLPDTVKSIGRKRPRSAQFEINRTEKRQKIEETKKAELAKKLTADDLEKAESRNAELETPSKLGAIRLEVKEKIAALPKPLKKEKPKKEEPKKEESKKEEAKTDENKEEEAKTEEPKKAAPKSAPKKAKLKKAKVKKAAPKKAEPQEATAALPKRSVAVDALPWNEVTMPDMFDDAEGFFGLEEVEGVEVVKEGGAYRFVRAQYDP